MEKNLQIYLHSVGNIDEKHHWNSEFIYCFSVVVKQIMGFSPILFSNMNNSESEYFVFESADDLKEKDAVIFILNPTPQKSDFDFIARLLPEVPFLKVFLIFRTFPKNIEIQESIKTLPAYNFFENNPYNLKITEYSPNIPGETESNFWNKLTDLTYDIKLRCLDQETLVLGNESQKTIYLAEVSNDQLKNRERLRRELLLSGYRVLPEKPLPSPEDEFEKSVSDALLESDLSIHMMGEVYGDSPEGSDYSYVEIQNKLFSKIESGKKDDNDHRPDVRRIIWFSPVFEPFEDKQNQYLKRLKKEISNSAETELIHSNLYDLKGIVDQMFSNSLSVNDKKSATNNLKILLFADKNNSEILSKLEQRFNLMNIEFGKFEDFAKNAFQLTSDIEILNKFSNFFVLQTTSNDQWVNSLVSILIRSKINSVSTPKSTIHLLVPHAYEDLPECAGIDISLFTYDGKNVDEALDSLMSRLKA